MIAADLATNSFIPADVRAWIVEELARVASGDSPSLRFGLTLKDRFRPAGRFARRDIKIRGMVAGLIAMKLYRLSDGRGGQEGIYSAVGRFMGLDGRAVQRVWLRRQ